MIGILIAGIVAMLIGGALATDPTDTLKLTGVAVFIFGIAVLVMGVVGMARGEV